MHYVVTKNTKVKAETNPSKEAHFAMIDVDEKQQDSKGQHGGH
jgi:hypothetical protein